MQAYFLDMPQIDAENLDFVKLGHKDVGRSSRHPEPN